MTRVERESFHSAVRKLSAELFQQKFGYELPRWGLSETKAFDSFLTKAGFFAKELQAWRLPLPTLAEVEGFVRALFASEGIEAYDPNWLADLERYKHGPLNKNGVPWSVLKANEAAERQRWADDQARVAADVAQRQLESRRYQAERATRLVLADLKRRGFTVWSPIGSAAFQFLATQSKTSTAGLGIVVIVGDAGDVAPRVGVTQAVVRRGVGTPDNPVDEKGDVTYVPSLE